MNFNKPPKTYAEQVEILRGRGLLVQDAARAIHWLAHHNYYRFSAYRFPFTISGNPDRFVPGATFEQICCLYQFDQSLRLLIAEATKRIEVSVRARWAYVLGHAYGPNAYENPLIFRDQRRHASALQKLDDEIQRSDEVFVTHYQAKYGMKRPPIWAACEVMSFGLLSRFYENIRRDSDKKQIANTYRLSISNLKSLLEHAVYLRNLSAHHSRLWNRRFTITVELPKSSPAEMIPNLHPQENRRIYNSLILFAHMVVVVEPGSTWRRRLLHEVQTLDQHLIPHMGFPSDWAQRPLWNHLLTNP